jgi:hypothetical protein
MPVAASLLIAAQVIRPGALAGQERLTDTTRLAFRTAYATQLRGSSSATARVQRVLGASQVVYLSYNAAVEGDYVRVRAAAGDSGWVYGRSLRADPSQVPYDTALIDQRGPNGQPVTFPDFPFPHFRIPLRLSLPAADCGPPPVTQRFADDGNWMLRCTMAYTRIAGSAYTIAVSDGFISDYASVPSYLRGVLSSYAQYAQASVLHDFLYWEQTCKKEEADRLFRLAMAQDGVGSATRWVFYWAVRLAGGSAWADNAQDRAGGLIRTVPPPFDVVPAHTRWVDYRNTLFVKGVQERPHAPVPAGVCALR